MIYKVNYFIIIGYNIHVSCKSEIEISDTYFAMGKPEQCMQMYTRFEKEVKVQLKLVSNDYYYYSSLIVQQQGDSSNEDHSTIQIDDEVYVQFVYAIYARLREMWEDKDFPQF